MKSMMTTESNAVTLLTDLTGLKHSNTTRTENIQNTQKIYLISTVTKYMTNYSYTITIIIL